MTNFGDWLKEELDARNIKPVELARRADIDPGAVTRILRGERKPNPETLQAIADALKLNYEVIFRAAVGKSVPLTASNNPAIEEILDLARQLPENDVADLIDLARGKLKRYERTEDPTRKS
jgi:transcriptional regulator with XRE-family HTH domain